MSVSVALVIQQAMRMRRVVLPSEASLASDGNTISHTWGRFSGRGELLTQKCFDFLYNVYL